MGRQLAVRAERLMGYRKKMARSKEITRAEEKIDGHLVLGARATGENLASVAAWIGQRK